MEQTSLVILSLLLTCGALCTILFVAWRAFGEQKHVLTWAIVFAVLAADLAINFAWSRGWLASSYLHWLSSTFLGVLAPVLALLGYRQRLEKHIYLPLQSGVVIAVCGVSAWFTFEQPHAGVNAVILPTITAMLFMWIAWVIYDVPRPKRSIEWASIVGYVLFAAVALSGALYGFGFGQEASPEELARYQLLLFLVLPSTVVVLGLLMLSMVAADLAKQAEDLTEYQEVKLREDTEKTWGTLQDVIEAIPDVVAIDDGKGVIVTCNEAFATLMQRTKDSIVGKRSVELFELYTKSFATIDNEKVKNGQHLLRKFSHALTTGASIEIVSSANRNYIVDAAYLRSGGQIMIARDVTQLSNARARLEAAINSLPIGFAFFDRNNQLVACNKNYEKVHQKETKWIEKQSVEKLMGNLMRRYDSFKDFSMLERSALVHDAINAIETRQSTNSVSKLDDGKWYEMAVEPVDGGGFVTFASDITNRRLLELEMEQNEAKLREILGSQSFPVIVTNNADMRVMFASRAATSVLADESDDLIGYEADKFLPLDVLSADEAPSSIDSETENALQEVQLTKKGGEIFPALLSSQNITYSGEAARVISFIDITNIHELTTELAVQRQALFQSEKLNALGTLLAGVAHELNNPLTVVVANAHVLGMSSQDEAVQSRIEKITNAADRCSKIVRSFLDMARKSPGETVAFDLLECIEQAMEITSFGLQEYKVELVAELPARLPQIVGDPDQFAQAIINLVINAQHALAGLDGERKITLSANVDEENERIELHIADNGPGIPADIRDRIFEPFFSTKKVGEGTGMGLSLVRNIIQAQGGEITLVPDDAGAHFLITLPFSDIQPSADVVADDRIKCNGPYNILIVDDDPAVREVLEDMLILQGHEVVSANSGEQALQELEAQAFDCMLSDLRMPDMDGPQLFEVIKTQYPHMEKRTGFVTGNNLSEQVREFLDTCERPSLGKPFLPEDLELMLYNLVESNKP
ncbi:ATP-binding protein [Kordiimonas aquimaris]|uniref:ATP-binding protein n=1 Tax=Kordiimonas aquimaris TaxID=707591 RepID=UPI0021CF999B|nr:ATP-binding protein [Kordiimonas aquimaris]